MRRSILAAAFGLVVVCAITVTSTDDTRGNRKIASFNQAKRLLHQEIYGDHRSTFYCGCQFDNDKKVIPSNCYEPKKKSRRSQRIEWEHIVPAHAFGQSFAEWRQGHPACVDKKGKAFKGRNCARKTSFAFKYMEADLHNLVPAIGEINGLRSNYSFAMIPGEAREFGECDMEIKDRKAEPAPEIRGDISRTYMYMDWAYPGRGIVSRKNRNLFQAWANADSVDRWECESARRVEAIQGNENPFVREPCMARGYW